MDLSTNWSVRKRLVLLGWDLVTFQEWHDRRIQDMTKTRLPNMPPWKPNAYLESNETILEQEENELEAIQRKNRLWNPRSYKEKVENLKKSYAKFRPETDMEEIEIRGIESKKLKHFGYKAGSTNIWDFLEQTNEKHLWMALTRKTEAKEMVVVTPEMQKDLDEIEEEHYKELQKHFAENPDPNPLPKAKNPDDPANRQIRVKRYYSDDAKVILDQDYGVQVMLSTLTKDNIPRREPNWKKIHGKPDAVENPYPCLFNSKRFQRVKGDKRMVCWNCLRFGHCSRDCKKETIPGFNCTATTRSNKRPKTDVI